VTTESRESLQVVRRYGVFALAGIALLIAALFIAASAIKVSGAVTAAGTFAVVDNIKEIAHPAGGVVAAIGARDGDHVKVGDVLFTLDSRLVREEIAATQAQVDMSRMTLARLYALRDEAEDVGIPDEMKERSAEPSVQTLLELQDSLLDSTSASQSAAAAQLGSQQEQLRIQLAEAERGKSTSQTQAAEIDRQINEMQTAPQSTAATPISSLIARKADATAESQTLAAQAAGLRVAIDERRQELAQLESAAVSETLQQIESEQKTLATLTSSLADATTLLSSLDVTAPADGVVAHSTLHTIGGVIRSGDTVMEVVPVGAGLVVEARLGAADIDKAHNGNNARVLLSGLDPSTPQLNGTIIAIAPDATQDEQTGSTTYLVQVSLAKSDLDQLDPDVQLISGMPAEVFITTRERSILSYLVEPLTSRLEHALRED